MNIKCFFGFHNMVVVKSKVSDRHSLTQQRFFFVKCTECNRIFNDEKFI